MQNTRFVPTAQPNKYIPGDAFMNEKKMVSENKIGQTTIRVYRPELTDEERDRRMKALYRAIADCYRAPKAR